MRILRFLVTSALPSDGRRFAALLQGDRRTHARGLRGDASFSRGSLGFRVLWDCVRVWSARARRGLGVLRLLVALVWVCFVLGLRVL